MAYIRAKNSDCVVVTEMGVLVEASVAELTGHPAIATGAYEIIDSDGPIFFKNRIIFEAPQ